MEALQRDLGRLEADVQNIKRDLMVIREDTKATAQDISEIKEVLQQQKGGMRVLWGVCTIAGVLGAAIFRIGYAIFVH